MELTGPAAEQVTASVGEDQKSLEFLEKEITQDKRVPIRFLMDGYLALVGGKCNEAITSFEQYSKDVPVKYHLLAAAYQRCGNNQKAIEFNNKIDELAITRPGERIKAKARNNIGNVYIRSGRLDEAVDAFQSALRADPTLYGVNYNLAAAYSQLGSQEEAIKRLCKYKVAHDPKANVINEVETDPYNDFEKLTHALGTQWKVKLTERLSSCTP